MPFDNDATSFDVPVTGGTGEFANVRGDVHIEQVSDGVERDTFNLIPEGRDLSRRHSEVRGGPLGGAGDHRREVPLIADRPRGGRTGAAAAGGGAAGPNRVTLRVTVGLSRPIPVHPQPSCHYALTCGDGRTRIARDGSGRGELPSQGRDRGSNPVGTTVHPLVRGLVRCSRLIGVAYGPVKVPSTARTRRGTTRFDHRVNRVRNQPRSLGVGLHVHRVHHPGGGVSETLRDGLHVLRRQVRDRGSPVSEPLDSDRFNLGG